VYKALDEGTITVQHAMKLLEKINTSKEAQANHYARLTGAAEGETEGDASNPYDRAAMRVTHMQARSRFTHAPIDATNEEHLDDEIRKDMARFGIKIPPRKILGTANEGFEGDGEISIDLHGKPSYKDLAHIIHHEDVHALLDPLPDLRPLGGAIDQKARAAWTRSDRGGHITMELPAYMIAWRPGDLKGFSTEDRNAWLKKFLPTMPPKTQAMMLRIMASHDASQRSDLGR